MKKITLFFIVWLMAFSSYSQSIKSETEIYQVIFGLEKVAIVEEIIRPNEKIAKDFWATYEEYERERKDMGQKRIDLIIDYAVNYDSLSDNKIDELVMKSSQLQTQLDKLIIDYYHKIKKHSSTKVAAQFYQIEHYFLTSTRSFLSQEIPFIDELK